MGNKIQLKDSSNNKAYPLTKTDAVYTDNANTLKDYLDTLLAAITLAPTEKSVTGNPLAIEDAIAGNAKGIVLKVEPHQEGTGDPSPDNVRPITGYDEVSIVRHNNENIYDSSKVQQSSAINSAGTVVSSTASDLLTYTTVESGAEYVFVRDYVSLNSANNRTIFFYDDNRTQVGTQVYTTTDKVTYFTVPADATQFRLPYDKGYTNIIISKKEYYVITDITLPTEAGTIYGATIDPVNGTMSVDRKAVSLTGGDNWRKSSSFPGSFFLAASVFGFKTQGNGGSFICSHAKYIGAPLVSTYVYGTCALDNSVNVFLGTADMTVEQFKTWLQEQNTAGTPVTVCGYLETPITYTLTPQQISLLSGVNNISMTADGTIELTYDADTKKILENM